MKKRWIDLAEHGIFLGDCEMERKFRLVLLDMNGMADPKKLKEINFVPVKTSPRYSKGVYFLDTDDQQLRPKALAAALGVDSCPLVDVDPLEIDKLFRDKLKERFNVTLNTITQQSLLLGYNKNGHKVYDTSVGRMVRITPENGVVEGSAQAAKEKLSPGMFLRAKTDYDLNECAEGFMQHILRGEKTNWSDVTKMAKAVFEYDGAPSNMQLRQLQEAIEASAYRHFANNVVEPSREAFLQAQNIYFSLPVSQMRSSESIALQQYSTPLPMAVIAQRLLVGHDDLTGKTLVEPTAGNGGLINALPSNKLAIYAIEYDQKRVEQLNQLPGINAQFGDATAINYKNYLDVPEGFDYSIVNPPFGKMDIARDFSVLKGVSKLDHFIPLRSLESRKDHGRSVFIIGADSNHSQGEIGSDSTEQFFNYLYDHYEVHGITEVDGRLYARQGAAYNVRMIVVGDKREQAVEQDVPTKFNVISTYEELWQWSENVIAQYTSLDESKRKQRAIESDEIILDDAVSISADFGVTQGALFDAAEKSVINNYQQQQVNNLPENEIGMVVRHVTIGNMTVGKLNRLLSKPDDEITIDDAEDLKDFKYFLLTDTQSAVEKGFMDTYQQDGGDVHVLKNKFWLVNIDYKLDEYQKNLPTDVIPLNEGDQFLTESGRVTSAFPKTNYKRESLNERHINQWLKDEAITEASYRRDKFNLAQWQVLDVENWSQSDSYAVNLYLFDDITGQIGNKKYKTTATQENNAEAENDAVEVEKNTNILNAEEREQEFKKRLQFVTNALESAKYYAVDDHTFDGKNIRISFEIIPEKNGEKSFINYVVSDKRNSMAFDVVDSLDTDLKDVTTQLRQRVKELNLIHENQQDVEVIESKSEASKPKAKPEEAQRNNNEFQV